MDDTATYRRARAGTGTARVLRISALAIAAGFAVWLLSNVLLEVFLAGLIAVILRAVVDTAVRRARIPERAALALVSLLAVAIPLTFSYYLGSRLISETEQLFVQLHRQFEFLRNLYGQTPIGGLIFDQLSPRHAIGAHLSGYAETLATSTVGGLTTLFIIVVISLYFTISPETYLSGTLRLFPIPHRPRARLVLREIGHALRWWTLGQIASMITVGLLTGTGLVLLGVPMAFALAMLAGLCTFVPYFGVIIALIPTMIVTMTVNLQTMLWAMAIFLVSHAAEAYVVSPMAQRSATHLPPALSILSMTILGTVFGLLGVILGTPIAAAALVLVREVYVGDALGDHDFARADRPAYLTERRDG